MNFQTYNHYFQQIVKSHPRTTWQKIKRKLNRHLQKNIDHWGRRWFDTTISDEKFYCLLAAHSGSRQSFLAQIANRQAPKFFITTEHRGELIAAIRTYCPHSEVQTVAAADQVCNHFFDLLGSGPTALGTTIDWHADFKSGNRWRPNQYYADIRSAAYPGGYDLKVPWELSRCQHLVWLGQAYWFTDAEKYAQKFVEHISDWIVQNPPRLGVNWACAMDVAIRAVNWLWGYYFFQDSALLTDDFKISFFKSLLVHGRHILNNLEWTETLTSNHYLSNIVGLVYLGILFPECKEAQQWRTFALQELEKEIVKQVYSDGMVFEASVNYHRLSTELFLSATLLAHLNGHQVSATYMARLEKMIEFTLYITKPDGTVPLIGDCDNGRLHRLKAWGGAEREWFDHRHLLSIGAILFDRSDFAQAAGEQWEEALWLWGAEPVKIRKAQLDDAVLPACPSSQLFPEAGLAILRHQDQYMALVAGPNGQNGNGGHAHNDKLSFEFYAAGQSWLVDPGAYIYTADHAQRNLFRSTAYHNTVLVGHQEQNRFAENPSHIFQLYEDTKPQIRHCEIGADKLYWVAEHDGYRRLSPPVLHGRTIFMHRPSSVWLVHDQIIGRAKHTCVTHFHLAPFLGIAVKNAGVIVSRRDSIFQHLFLLSLEPTLKAPIVREDWVSKGYGIREAASTLAWEWPENIDTTTWAICIGDNMNEVEQRVAVTLQEFRRNKEKELLW